MTTSQLPHSNRSQMHDYNLRPRRPKRLLPLFWYTLPDELLFHIGQQATRKYALRSRDIKKMSR